MLDLTGKKALVTGGSRGIGNRLARALHEAGAEVVIFYNHTCPDGLAQEMQGDGPAVHAVQCDVADCSSLERGGKGGGRPSGRPDRHPDQRGGHQPPLLAGGFPHEGLG
ncbi:SDR family NAD(P)-dependent oxidoreductase [Oscillibacter valericigenes]|uniref:SDR family NAD(P)-dependent oxidoreductase n=1 Tax=Oscillibacter valericigenes TaxID=351091 RepID=A0ABS2FWX9_9FIRM|nr:SDR family NAD(P)-dependent oxidoreductase [Oscillibacter valericigenes]